MLLTACAPIATPTILVPTIAPVAPPIVPTPTSFATAVPRSTPQPIESAIEAVTRALQAKDTSTLQLLLNDQVLLAQGPEANVGGLIARTDAMAWLNERWGNHRAMVSTDYIEHFEMIEVTTSGWSIVAPMLTDRLVFHLHRYEDSGRGDALNGAWRIDAILYQ